MAKQTNQAKPAHRLIKRPTVESMTTLSTSEIYRRIEAGTFPAQIKLGVKAVAWLEHEVNDWISQTVEQDRAKAEA